MSPHENSSSDMVSNPCRYAGTLVLDLVKTTNQKFRTLVGMLELIHRHRIELPLFLVSNPCRYAGTCPAVRRSTHTLLFRTLVGMLELGGLSISWFIGTSFEPL